MCGQATIASLAHRPACSGSGRLISIFTACAGRDEEEAEDHKDTKSEEGSHDK